MKLLAFAAASALLAATPGPGVLYVVTRTLAAGRRAGLAAVAGVALGNAANAVLASLGLAALFALWPAAFDLVRWAGGAYLLGLGLQAWRRPAGTAPETGGSALRQGLWVALLNPKTTLFFAAFLPPFLDPARPAAPQSLMLGALFVAIAAASDSAYVLAAARLGAALRRPALARAGRGLAAAVYIGLGVFALWPARPA